MKTRKYILILLFLISNVFAQIKIGKINDPDGYVNVRDSSSNKSKIVCKIKDDELFEYVENNSNWYWVSKIDGTQGFVNKSRIKEKFMGIIHKGKIYNNLDYKIIINKVSWNDLQVYVIHVAPKNEVNDYNEKYQTDIVDCSAKMKIFKNNKEINSFEYINIDAVGSCAGVSFPKNQFSNKFLFGCKYGDYDGRVIQIDLNGKMVDYTGGNYFVTNDKKYLISEWYSDLRGITIIDIENGKEYFEKEFKNDFADWFEHDGEYYNCEINENNRYSGQVYKLNLKAKKFQRMKINFKTVLNYKKVEFLDNYPSANCFCGQ